MDRAAYLSPSPVAPRRAPVRVSFMVIMLALGAASALALASGCAMAIDAPEGYARLSDPWPYDYKAVSTRGCAIAVRQHANEDEMADLSFWSGAIEYQKVERDGMKMAARDAIKFRTGEPGTLFTFESGEGAGRMLYLVAVQVTPRRIATVEAAGPAADMENDREKLRAAVETLR
ncbi:MAG: hypothetical protein HY719_06125 [Planctomycetes bacterium]|nr:hypothetical protein [Planctomycetota bacterium]